MIRPLGERPPIPSPAMVRLAAQLEGEARRLAKLARGSGDVDLGRLWQRLAMWSAAVSHLAKSGPASHDVALRVFDEHPDHDRAGEDPMVRFEALSDTIGYLAVGDMVLGAIAATFLGRWGVAYPDDNPWPALVGDDERLAQREGQAVLGAARSLDLDLRDARHRIVAHRRRAHTEVLSWDRDDVLTINLANLDLPRIEPEQSEALGLGALETALATENAAPEPLGATLALLEAANERLEATVATTPGAQLPARGTATSTIRSADAAVLFDHLHGHARWLDGEARRLVRRAHQIAGYESVSPIRVATAAMRFTAAITEPSHTSRQDQQQEPPSGRR